MALERSSAAVKAWMEKNMSGVKALLPEAELEVVAHTMVYSEQFEEFVHLNFKNHAVCISLNRTNSDETILKHYGEKGVCEYTAVVSTANYPGYDLPLRITKLGFVSASKDLMAMPEDCQKALYDAAANNDAVQYRFFGTGKDKTLCFAWKNVQKRFFLYRLANAFRRHEITMKSSTFQYVDYLSIKSVLLGKIEITGEKLADETRMKRFVREFELLKNFRNNDALVALVEKKSISGNQANALRAMTSLIGQILAEVNPALYTEENIMEAFVYHEELTLDVVAMLDKKFHPKEHDLEAYKKLETAFVAKLASLDTGMKKHDDRRRAIFQQALNVIQHILKTNMFDNNKLGIGFRLNPTYLDNVPGFDRKSKFPEIPFGIFFVKGWNYFGFHCRFRDLARGGMRTVVAWDTEREKFERANMFTECYGLAYTQQKKNKDIPEGGSKAILFLNANEELPGEAELARREMIDSGMSAADVAKAIEKFKKDQQLEYMYYNQRCFVHTFLSLFVWDFEKKALKHGEGIVDYLNVPEYIYLGPDENFHDSMIDWVAHEAVRMGYSSGSTFISGKEETGVNHKEFGVTSWGALQYLNHALKFAGITGNFTVKMSGGSDGDVGGNFQKLLGKYYAEKAKLIVVTDGTGTCYDPEGLNYPALTKMFAEVKAIAEYPKELLHEGAWILCIRQTRQATALSKEALMIRGHANGKPTEEWIPLNQANHIYATNAHTTKADVFLPCGGRPRSLRPDNIDTFLDENGKPTSRVIVEGANLYITPEARVLLEDKGVILFKDSSANKCGVVSSSYEILAGLSMTDEQFVQVKPTLAQNILDRLEFIANDEARCMLEYYEKMGRKVYLSAISDKVSEQINKFTDDIATYLKPLDLLAPENKKLLEVFQHYVPQCIASKYMDQAMKRVPDMHKKAIIATVLACRVVYSRGLAWEPSIVDSLPQLLAEMQH